MKTGHHKQIKNPEKKYPKLRNLLQKRGLFKLFISRKYNLIASYTKSQQGTSLEKFKV